MRPVSMLMRTAPTLLPVCVCLAHILGSVVEVESRWLSPTRHRMLLTSESVRAHLGWLLLPPSGCVC